MAFPRQQTAEQTRPANWFAAWHWTRKAKNKTDMILCVYWGLLVQNFISFKLNRHIWAVVSNNIVKDRERREIPFPFLKMFILVVKSQPQCSKSHFQSTEKGKSQFHFTPRGPYIRCLNRMLELPKKKLETEAGYVDTSLMLLNSVKTTKWGISYRAESHQKTQWPRIVDGHLMLKYVHIWLSTLTRFCGSTAL